MEQYVLLFVCTNVYNSNMDSYIRPSEVQSPKRQWSLIHVLFDGGPDESSLAIGRWEGEPVLAMRWNGNAKSPLGSPQSRGLPTWFVVPRQYWRQILETEPYKSVHDDALTLARNFLELRRTYFLSRCPNPSCQYYGGLVLHSFRLDELEQRIAEVERNEFKLYHIICNDSWDPSPEEKSELLLVLRTALEHYRRTARER